jgi:two-component system, OmpR family, response regulator
VTIGCGTGAGARETKRVMKSDPRILVVNDDEDTLFLIVYAATQEFPGSEVLTCHNAAEALALVGIQRVDAIITDNGMPGMSGVAMVRALRATDVTTKVLMLTGSEQLRGAALGAGVDAFMVTGGLNDIRQGIRTLMGPRN